MGLRIIKKYMGCSWPGGCSLDTSSLGNDVVVVFKAVALEGSEVTGIDFRTFLFCAQVSPDSLTLLMMLWTVDGENVAILL